MNDWRDLTIRLMTSFEGVGAAVAAGLVLFAWFVLSGPERKWVRLPAWLLVVYVILEVLTRSGPAALVESRTTALLSQLLLLVALTRIAFVLGVDWFVGKRLGKPIPRIFRDILQGLLYIVIAIVLFRSMGVELGSLLTTSAILTAVIGLSLQESLGNLVAGLAVRAEHPFEIGDWVEIGEGTQSLGRVVEINWRATKLRTNDLVDIIVPNGLIAKSTISNFSRPSRTTRRTVAFQGPYEVPPDRVRAAVLTALRGCPGVAAIPSPRLWLTQFGDSGVDYRVVYFLDDFAARNDIESDIRWRIWYGLRRAQITIPFPIRDVRITRARPESTAAVADTERARRCELLASIQFFAGMPEAMQKTMAAAMHSELYAEGERIIVEGESGNDLFIVEEGSVIVTAEGGAGGEPCTLATLGPGQMFGELSLVTGIRSATVVAAEESVLLRLDHDDFRRIATQIPELAESLLTQIVERQGQLGRPETLGLDPATPNGALRTALFDKIRRFFS